MTKPLKYMGILPVILVKSCSQGWGAGGSTLVAGVKASGGRQGSVISSKLMHLHRPHGKQGEDEGDLADALDHTEQP